mmetsp:Transcript_485/g.1154  ORF Transcript_485/g.1154 Transcript_485/m.1154 type:complete len:205 (-) Transcript_485:125-739(-)
MGLPSAMVPWMNFLIASCWLSATASLTRSILFCRMMMFLSCMISTAARCSDVCGCGHDSFAAMRSSAPSMTAAPLSMVAMRMSCPGQSTNETCLTSFILAFSNPATWHGGSSSMEDPYARYRSGRGHAGSAHSYILALAYPSLIVIFRSSSFLNRTVCMPEIAFTTVDLPCATCPMVPMLMVACRDITSGDKGVNADGSSVDRS